MDIQGRYIKEYLQTFFSVPFKGGPEEEYKFHMIENNRTNALLKMSLAFDGGEEACRYPVGGMKAMDLVFRTLNIDLARLVAILKSFVEAVEEVADLLLDPDDLVLIPECVFINITDYKAGFIYLPGYGRSIRGQAEIFFEYMLNRVDYDDRRAVTLLYDCYILIMKEEKGIAGLKERIAGEAPPTVRNEIREEPVTVIRKENELSVPKEEPSLKSWFSGRFKKKRDSIAEQSYAERERIFDESTRDTVLLSARKQECNPCLISVKNDERTVIGKFPFMIGSLPGHTDYTPGGNVSRLHAEIRKTGRGITLVDLNSTNGSKLNGNDLVPGEEYALFNNDRISFADMDFIYKEGMVLS